MNRRLISPTFETRLFCIRSAFNNTKHIKRWEWLAGQADGRSGWWVGGRLTGWSVGWVVCWVGGLLGGWSVGWVVCWVGGRLGGWSVGWVVGWLGG